MPSILSQLLADSNPHNVGDSHGSEVENIPHGHGLSGASLESDDNVEEECQHGEEHGDYTEYLRCLCHCHWNRNLLILTIDVHHWDDLVVGGRWT